MLMQKNINQSPDGWLLCQEINLKIAQYYFDWNSSFKHREQPRNSRKRKAGQIKYI